MNFDWKDLLALAEYVFATADSCRVPEAAHRGVASRAYYACLCKERDFLVQEGLMEHLDQATQAQGFHSAVIGLMAMAGGRDRKSISANTDRLRNIRRDADYEASPRFTRQRAEIALETAKRVYQQLESLPPAS